MSFDEVKLSCLFRRELDLCGLKAGEVVGIYTEGGTRADYARAFSQAAESMGASAFHIDLPQVSGKVLTSAIGGRGDARGLTRVAPAVTAFKEADLMIDLVLLLFEPELEEIKKAGTRVISCIEPPEVLERMFPTSDERLRSEAALATIRKAKRLQVTSPAGTDIVYELGEMEPFCQYGYSDTPGRWDQFPSTFVVHCPNATGTSGRVVLAPGDVIWPLGRFVQYEVEILVEDGYITDISGGVEAMLLRDAIERAGDPQASAISHIGWGLNQNARWDSPILNSGTIGMDSRSYEGCVMFATGPNVEFGGTNDTSCHFDIPMRGCSLQLDDELLITDGSLITPH